jgi:hypothetical protein
MYDFMIHTEIQYSSIQQFVLTQIILLSKTPVPRLQSPSKDSDREDITIMYVFENDSQFIVQSEQ